VVLPPLPGRVEVRVPHFDRDLLRLQAQQLGRDYRDDRFRAGADVLHAEAELDAAVGVDLRLALGLVARAAAGQAAPAQPTPVLTTPGELPGLRYFCFQPNLSAPKAYSRWRMGLGSFLSRNSTGSMPSFTARSSMADSMP